MGMQRRGKVPEISEVNRAGLGGRWKTFCAWPTEGLGILQFEKKNTGTEGGDHVGRKIPVSCRIW